MSNNLKLQVFLSAIDKVSTPFKHIATQSKALSQNLQKTRGNLKQLESQQKLINQFKQLKVAVLDKNNALQAAKNKAQALAQQLNATTKPTKAMQVAFERARSAVKKLEAEQQKYIQKLISTRQALNDSGINTRRLSVAQQELSHKMKLANQQIKGQEDRLSRLNQKAKANAAYTAKVQGLISNSEQIGSIGQRAMIQSYVIGSQLAKPVANFMAFEDAMAGVARQVKGLKDESGKFTPEYDVWFQLTATRR